MSDPGARGSRAAMTAVGGVAGAVLVLLLAVWTASIGPDGVFSGDGPSAERSLPNPTAAPTTIPVPESPLEEREREETFTSPGWVRVVALLSQITTGLVLLYVALRLLGLLRRRWAERTRVEQPRPEVDFEVLQGLAEEETAAAIVNDATEQRDVLSAGAPRNAIVACWHRFELRAENGGIQREAWETSAEFTLRVLDRISADSGPVSELAELYREARFSEHPLGEPDRARAVQALERIHGGLSSRPGPRKPR